MEKASIQMELEEWELLTNDGFLELGHGSGKNRFIHPSHPSQPSHPSHLPIGAMEDSAIPADKNKPQAHIPVRSGPTVERNTVGEEIFVKEIREIREIAPPPAVVPANQEAISRSFLTKLGEDEFADTKMESPDSPGSSASRRVKPLIEAAEPIQYEESMSSPEIKEKGCLEGFGFGIWKWRSTGIGALCSVGVAAATVCVLVLGGRHHQKQKQQQQQNQKLQFQIYADEKSIKKVVQQATRLNQAISGMRGVPITRAHISFGSYYDDH